MQGEFIVFFVFFFFLYAKVKKFKNRSGVHDKIFDFGAA